MRKQYYEEKKVKFKDLIFSVMGITALTAMIIMLEIDYAIINLTEGRLIGIAYFIQIILLIYAMFRYSKNITEIVEDELEFLSDMHQVDIDFKIIKIDKLEKENLKLKDELAEERTRWSGEITLDEVVKESEKAEETEKQDGR